MRKLFIVTAAAAALAAPAFAKDCGAKATTAAVGAAHPVAAMTPIGYGKKAEAASAETKAAGTIVDVAAGNPDFSTLVAAVKAAGLVETLSGAGPFTVFAPTNAAFAALPAGTVENLLKPENKAQLTSILTFHVIPAKVLAADIKDGRPRSPPSTARR